MFVAVVRFPAVPAGRDHDFRQWFAWSGDQLRGVAGLRARRLLLGQDGAYTALVESDSAETFAAMHDQPVAADVQARLHQILDDAPHAMLYEVVEDALAGTCCSGHGDHREVEEAPSRPTVEAISVSGDELPEGRPGGGRSSGCGCSPPERASC